MKNSILGWLFKGYVEKLNKDSQDSLELQIEAFKATLDIKDLIRERMKSIRPRHPDEDTILRTHIAGLDDDGRLSFYSKAHQVTENEAFKITAESLLSEFQQKAGLYSGDMTTVNFNRAGVNGVQLLEEELLGLSTTYKIEKEERRKMTEEERHSAI